MILPQKARGVLQLFRPELPLAAGMCVVIGQLLALGTFPALYTVGLGFACGFFLSSSALITNDYFDLEVDRINAPQRPLPTGLLTRFEVMTLGIATALIGLAAAWAFNPFALGLSFAIWLMGFAYNWKLKATGLWGNLIVSASVASTFLLGGMVVGQPWNRTVWAFGLVAFVFDLAEEIAGDAMDAEGDQQRASTSIALVYGKRTALRISSTLFMSLVVMSVVPLVWGGLPLLHILTIVVTDLLIIFFVIQLLRSHTPTDGRRAMRGLYLSASLGLLAFLLGALFI